MRYATARMGVLVALACLVCASCINSRYKRHYEGERLEREEVAVIRFEYSEGGMAIKNGDMEKEYRSARATGQLGVAVQPGRVEVTTRIKQQDLRDVSGIVSFGDRRIVLHPISLSSSSSDGGRTEEPVTLGPETLQQADSEVCARYNESCYQVVGKNHTYVFPMSEWDLDDCTMTFIAEKGQQYHLVRRSIIVNSTLVQQLKDEGLTEDELRHTYLVKAHPLVNPQAMIGRRSSEYVASCCEGPACVQLSAYRHESGSQ